MRDSHHPAESDQKTMRKTRSAIGKARMVIAVLIGLASRLAPVSLISFRARFNWWTRTLPEFKACTTPALLLAFAAPILLLRLLNPPAPPGVKDAFPSTFGFAYFVLFVTPSLEPTAELPVLSPVRAG